MFACPNCGGNLKFDIPSQQLACEYCHTQADPYSFEDKDEESFAKQEYEVTVFTCPQCGGEIVSTDTSAAELSVLTISPPHCGQENTVTS